MKQLWAAWYLKAGMLITAAVLVSGCATSAEKKPAVHWASYLAAGADIYGSLEVKSNSVFLGNLARGNATLEDLVRRTQRTYFSLSWWKKPQAEYRILALGDYPAGWLGLYLDWQKDFKKYPAPPAQWLFKDNIYVYQPENGAVLAGGKPFTAGVQEQPPPLQAVDADHLEGHQLFLHMPDPTGVFLGPGLGNALTLDSLSGFFKAGAQSWTGEALGRLKDEKSARMVHLGLKMLLGGWARTSEDPRIRDMMEKVTLKLQGTDVIMENLEIPYSLASDRLRPLLEAAQ